MNSFDGKFKEGMEDLLKIWEEKRRNRKHCARSRRIGPIECDVVLSPECLTFDFTLS
jgi:hypothetical protein